LITEKMTGGRNTKSRELRSGYTTGSCAAAASKAAALALVEGVFPKEVYITLPGGGELLVPVKEVKCDGEAAVASVIKDAGDDPDVTDGLVIMARVSLQPGEIVLKGGIGVGKVTKPGLAVPVGEPAINPVPRAMIEQEAGKVLGGNSGAVITIEAPGGGELASKTLNPRLGIEGGISILGTSGIVRPMSEDAYIRSLVPQIDQALALGYNSLILTPGRMGADRAERIGFPADAVVQTSNFIGTMLEECASRGIKSVILMGHLGKLLKVAAGIFHTHSRLADARRETLAAHAALLGARQDVVKLIMQLNTAEESVDLLERENLMEVYTSIASMASIRAEDFCDNGIKVGTILYSFSRGILGYDKQAVILGGELGWKAELP